MLFLSWQFSLALFLAFGSLHSPNNRRQIESLNSMAYLADYWSLNLFRSSHAPVTSFVTVLCGLFDWLISEIGLVLWLSVIVRVPWSSPRERSSRWQNRSFLLSSPQRTPTLTITQARECFCGSPAEKFLGFVLSFGDRQDAALKGVCRK